MPDPDFTPPPPCRCCNGTLGARRDADHPSGLCPPCLVVRIALTGLLLASPTASANPDRGQRAGDALRLADAVLVAVRSPFGG